MSILSFPGNHAKTGSSGIFSINFKNMKINVVWMYSNFEASQYPKQSKFWKYQQSKGQLISKCIFGVFTFFQKTNENKTTSSKVEFVCLFFGSNVALKKSFQICLTFNMLKPFLKMLLHRSDTCWSNICIFKKGV